MHVGLTELLRCPRCGSELVLLTERAVAGRVLEGTLGCAGCGARFPVRDGVADLRPSVQAAVPEAGAGRETRSGGPAPVGAPRGAAGGPPAEAAFRLAALLGLEDARGVVLLVGTAAIHAGEVAALAGGIEVVPIPATAESAAAWSAGLSGDRVSPLLAGPRLPFADRRIAAVALPAGAHVEPAEAVRVLAPGRRLVLTGAVAATEAELDALECRVIARAEDVVVAERTGAPDPPRLYQLA